VFAVVEWDDGTVVIQNLRLISWVRRVYVKWQVTVYGRAPSRYSRHLVHHRDAVSLSYVRKNVRLVGRPSRYRWCEISCEHDSGHPHRVGGGCRTCPATSLQLDVAKKRPPGEILMPRGGKMTACETDDGVAVVMVVVFVNEAASVDRGSLFQVAVGLD
jgi:hypothetical protein